MRKVFGIFKIARDERWAALLALLYAVLWNALVIHRYADWFMALTDNYHRLFVRTFHISGYDPLTYSVLSQWGTEYNIYRHPLLAFFMYPLNQLNQGLMLLTGMNWVQVIVAVLLVFCATYSFIFLTRIFREVVGIRRRDAFLLGALTMSFAYVMVAISVPDHFSLSMFMLILTLYVAGRKMKANHPFTIWQTVLFFLLTAGISLNNGIKVFLANLFTNGRKFWRLRHLLLAVIIPSAVLWGGARLEWHVFEQPKYAARQAAKARAMEKRHARLAQAFRDTTQLRDTAAIRTAIDTLIARQDAAREQRKQHKAMFAHQGKPMGKGEFTQWTDASTPRLPALVESVFGESIQLHPAHLLEDVLSTRPIIVRYTDPSTIVDRGTADDSLHPSQLIGIVNYVVEALLVLLFLAGIFVGRRSRFLWLALSFFGFDMFIHVVLGFGLTEAYIMSPHWLFTLTIAMAYLFRTPRSLHRDASSAPSRLCVSVAALRIAVAALTLFFLCWNGWLYARYLL